jgi:hypothetical protein
MAMSEVSDHSWPPKIMLNKYYVIYLCILISHILCYVSNHIHVN